MLIGLNPSNLGKTTFDTEKRPVERIHEIKSTDENVLNIEFAANKNVKFSKTAEADTSQKILMEVVQPNFGKLNYML